MYKKVLSIMVLLNLVFAGAFLCIKVIEDNRLLVQTAFSMKLDDTFTADGERSTLGIAAVASSGQRVVDCAVLCKESAYKLQDEDMQALLRIVEAEAGCEDEDGRLLVANVVLNRVNNDDFPDTISQVVFQKEKGVTQFSPISDGSYYQIQISQETREAVERALDGEDISQGALYFAARQYAESEKMKWFDEHLTFLFEHGGHEFFR